MSRAEDIWEVSRFVAWVIRQAPVMPDGEDRDLTVTIPGATLKRLRAAAKTIRDFADTMSRFIG